MNLSLWVIVCSIVVSSLTLAVAGENANSKKNNPTNQMKDDVVSDDEDAEGSGFGESQYDLESSGSGYGPDDEDGPEFIANGNLKSGKSRGDEKTFPMPKITSTAESISSSPSPKHISESSKPFDEDLRANPGETASNKNEDIFSNHGVPSKNNFEPVENENHNREIVSKNGLEEDGTFDNHHPDDKSSVDENPRIDTNVGVYKVNTPDRDRTSSFFAQPGILAAVIGGAVVGLLCAILVVMFIVYRMRRKDEGSYPLEEMKRCAANNHYMKPNHREFFA